MRNCFLIISVLLITCTQGVAGDWSLKRNESGKVVSAEFWGKPNELHKTRLHESPQLEYLMLTYGTNLTAADIAYLAKLTQLRELHMGFPGVPGEYVTVNGNLLPLQSLKSLEVVSLCKENTKDADLQFLTSLPKIESVEFGVWSGERLTQPGSVTDKAADVLAKAKSLRRISITGDGEFTDRFVSTIARGLPQLTTLEIWSDKLTDESLRHIARSLRKLERLNIQSSRFTDKGVSHLRSLKNLESLEVSSKSLNGKCAVSVSALHRLNHLSLTIPAVDDEAFAAIAGLKNLEILSLRRPQLTDSQFAMLRAHPKLESAFLNGSKLSVDGTAEVIRSIPNLNHWSFGGTSEAFRRTLQRQLKQNSNQ